MMEQNDIATLLETLCPMFLLLNKDGEIQRVGPTLQKLRPDLQMTGMRFLDLFELL